MNTKPIIVVTLIAVSVVVLASLGVNFLTPGKPCEFLGLNLADEDGRFIPPVAGGLAFAGGIIFLLLKSKHA
jgi:hypothetical protein